MARARRDDQALVREVLGAPLVPPARITREVLRLRRGLMRAHRAAAPPSLRVLDALFGLFDNRVLGLLCELGIPELLDRPRPSAELADATGAPDAAMARLLRFSAARGFVGVDRKGRYRANAVTAMLRHDHPGGWRGWVEFASSDWFWAAWQRADAPFGQPPMSGMRAATGREFFDHLEAEPATAGRTFHAAMAAGATMQAVALSHALDWDGVTRVCDVGGGTGAAMAMLTRLRPDLQPVVLDLPAVVAEAPAGMPTVGGDFFEQVPEGFDRYLLLAVVHDWDDADAARILRRIRAAMPPHASIVVVENVLPDTPRDEFVVASDLLMLVLGPGTERTAAQFDALFTRSGLAVREHTILPTGFSAFELGADH